MPHPLFKPKITSTDEDSRTNDNLRNEIDEIQQKFDETFYEAWDRFNDLLRGCPHHGFSELHQLDTFYNALNSNDQDSLNSAAGGNFLDKMPRECYEKSSRASLSAAAADFNQANSGYRPRWSQDQIPDSLTVLRSYLQQLSKKREMTPADFDSMRVYGNSTTADALSDLGASIKSHALFCPGKSRSY
ncbi:reverse transcriptase domain-containing protein [Tanacetum coccineum]|uniref:Reverse transcriptase domain-containing protein n=1 Tax=Tanacetum coccineum TaxID=301880 RepID=A0ABQ4WB77_9ASTR